MLESGDNYFAVKQSIFAGPSLSVHIIGYSDSTTATKI
jgi:hypothetical protein